MILTSLAMVNVMGTTPGPLITGTLIIEFAGLPRGTFRVALRVGSLLKEPEVPGREAITINDLWCTARAK